MQIWNAKLQWSISVPVSEPVKKRQRLTDLNVHAILLGQLVIVLYLAAEGSVGV
jgi:hypothetical protein